MLLTRFRPRPARCGDSLPEKIGKAYKSDDWKQIMELRQSGFLNQDIVTINACGEDIEILNFVPG
jgi:hypothetical protein